ncbi:MAG: endonuclease III [Spirochaetaceae bacterium]|jgi:endonuclease-3|nr:endonuclease III [Spirochaetaceae bacterium]
MTDWPEIFAALNKWRKDLSLTEPSVTLVAERYARDPWAVLTSTLISLRTKDEVTIKASAVLLARCKGPSDVLGASQAELEKCIYPAGFYKTKALRLREIAAILIDKYEGRVPDTLDELLALPGVGRKTANLVLIEAFDKDGICVDTHVHRINNRAGWLTSKSPDATELILRDILPREYWKPINAILVLYGQRVCKPISPICSRCVIAGHCARKGVGKSR